MTRPPSDVDVGPRSTEALAVRPLELAQRVWQRAVTLARSDLDADRVTAPLDLIRTAHLGPSTLLHALRLGREQQRATPADVPTRRGVQLLARTIGWLGRPTENDEVGLAGSPPATNRPPVPPPVRR